MRKQRRKVKSINYAGTIEGMHTKKRRRIWPLFVIFIFIIAVAGAGYYLYHSNQEEEVTEEIEFGNPTLPRIVSIEEGKEVNELLPYVNEMDILTMRDTISPLTPQGKLVLEIKPYESEIESFTYEILSMDGSKVIAEDVVTDWDDNQIQLSLSSVVTDVQESLMKATLTLSDGREVYYYTRLIAYGSCYLSQNMDFVTAFHTNIYEKDINYLSTYLTETASSTSLQYVDINSEASQVAWGELAPTIVGEVKWKITECTSLFISIQLEYQVEIVNEDSGNKKEYYNVVEFYRTGYSSTTSSVQLKQYSRTVNQIYTGDEDTIETDGIVLGILDDSTTYMVNEEETSIVFTQERGLYVYHQLTNDMVEVFSLEEWNESDSRYRNNEYDIRILSIDENGSVNFLVYGYMNRGIYEGQVGSNIYSYDAVNNTLIDKAFIVNNKSFSVGEEEMAQGMYYSNTQDIIYIIAQDTFYEVSIIENTQNVLATNMDAANYAISDDGKYVAYGILSDESGVSDVSDQLEVLDLETGNQYSITTDDSSCIRPLGFLEHDLIYGYYLETDTLVDETETEITPMYLIEICDDSGKVQKSYINENQYIRDIYVTDNMVTMNLLEKEDGTYVYAGQDIITNNAEKVVESAETSTFSTEKKQVQKKLLLEINANSEENTFTKKSPLLIANLETIKISYDSDTIEEMYYAYAYGELQVASEMASEAIQYASENVGAVINEKQEYVWRSGSRDLTYTVSTVDTIASRMSAGESAIEIVSESANLNVSSYTGCTTEQMCYIINQGQVIAAKLQDDTWVMFVGYTGDTMVYLNQNGVKQTCSMSDFDDTIIELIGDGIF